ncbi:uncharacterized protein LOC130670127 [Microplitis mediator]|uniref:uncharacterized protein LOC130670127 n=1 Tax=Microplitis mediator TaxID=375433 RepID=UPI002552F51C|nr:uncharacterized protein LOC130670127 [Microplitis mediator]
MEFPYKKNWIRFNGRKPLDKLTNDQTRKVRKVHNDNFLRKQYTQLTQPILNSSESIPHTSEPACLPSAEPPVDNIHSNNFNFAVNFCNDHQEVMDVDSSYNSNENNNNSNKNNNNINENHNNMNENNNNITDPSIPINSSVPENQNIHDTSFNPQVFRSTLAKCIVDNKINLTQSKALLEVLRTHPDLLFLPKDPRSLIKTPREKIVTKIVAPGEYLHIGFESKLKSMISRIPFESIPETLVFDFSTDGAELNKKIQIWPIQIRLINIPFLKNPELVGIYKGESKPQSFEDFFVDFVSEVELIISKGGIDYKGKKIPIQLRCYIADSPARANALGHVSHVARNPCSKCKIEGITYKKSCRFPGINYELRTDEEYRNLTDVDHHTGVSAIRKLPMDLVNQVSFDYMHLVCLGVMKKTVQSVIFGKFQVNKLQAFEIDYLSNRLMTLQNYCPREFARIPRELDKYGTFKATEFRQLLLYTFIVVSNRIITNDQYNHFLLLHTSMRVLLSDSSSEENVNFAEKALEKFIIDAEKTHGLEFLSYNIHGLIHLVADYKRFGSLESTSAFTYENSIRLTRPFVRKPDQPLQQIHKRFEEQTNFQVEDIQISNSNTFKAYGDHENGPIFDGLIENSEQYENLRSPKFFYSIHNNDNTIITKDNRIGIIQNIIFKDGTYYLAIRFFKTLESYFEILGRPSTNFGVYLCTSLKTTIEFIVYDEIRTKCYRMPIWVKRTLTPFVNDELLNNAYVAIEMLL